MSWSLGSVERKGHALELEGDGSTIDGGDVVCVLEELVQIRVVCGLDSPAVGGVSKGGVRVVDREVHKVCGTLRS